MRRQETVQRGDVLAQPSAQPVVPGAGDWAGTSRHVVGGRQHTALAGGGDDGGSSVRVRFRLWATWSVSWTISRSRAMGR
ncbi:hypothetical protein ACFWBS_38440 [Streptomyces mirabilis]|uniref:hypothetical protein n=1 Tax=Streptomyces TaxID=1883 RepID=UPI0015CF44F1|nr:hypothetical protein [Streptomyces sp. OK228]